jgi:uncharacterized protein (TIGR02271 family)
MDTIPDPLHAEDGSVVVPVSREQLEIKKRVVDTGCGVRVTKRVTEQQVPVQEQLWQEEVAVARVAVDQVVATPPQSRYEGDVLVVPVVEEVVVMEKRFRIKEELRITTTRRHHAYRDTIALRVEDVQVEPFNEVPGASANHQQEHSTMSHTLAAVFDNRADAERACDAVCQSGIPTESVQLSPSTTDDPGASTGAAAAADQGGRSFGDSIKHFFSDLFVDDRDDQALYGEAVNRGNVVLTVQAQTEEDVERVADIIEGFGPVDIDEQRGQWEASGWRSAAAGTLGAQQSASMQSATTDTSSTSASAGSMQGGSQGQASTGSMQRAQTDSQAESQVIPVMQEALKVGKRVVQRGGVRIFQRLIETPVEENVSLREEHVSIQRRPADQQIDPDQVGAFKEASFEVRESAEEAVVQKSAKVVEEVVVGKDTTERTEQVRDTVRRTEVDVEQLGSAELEDDYRDHFASNYGNRGETYDSYAPAYRFGSAMRSDESYRNRSWVDAEGGLRNEWESSNPQSTWDDVKEAIKRGWDKMTS